MKSLVALLDHLLQDCGRECGADYARDSAKIHERVKHEGDSFITITLPRFCSDFERCLDFGRVTPGLFLSFGKEKSGIPSFLKGFLRHVFDVDGTLRTNARIDCIRAIRQICLFGKKILRPCSPEREEDAIAAFVSCDDGLGVDRSTQLWRYFGHVCDILVEDMLLESTDLGSLKPQHGPGTTQEGIRGNAKYAFQTWHDRLEQVGLTFLTLGRASPFYSKEEDGLEPIVLPKVVLTLDEKPVKVTLVPKTLKSPRIIAIEPVCMQYTQQALKRVLVEAMETSPITRGRINFSDQTVNQRLALEGSISPSWATIDLSEASDRVSLDHVQRAFASCPKFLGWMLAARSTRAKLPSGDVVPLKKFASMGSALCFPVEAFVFFASMIASRIRRAGRFPTRAQVRSSARGAYVYGDDLVVPVHEASGVCDDLESLDFRVNRRKSFWTGQFRESCGLDGYGGEKVTPVYLRRDLPRNPGDASALLSAVSTYHQLIDAGRRGTAMAIRKAITRVYGELPLVPAAPLKELLELADGTTPFTTAGTAAIGWMDYSHVLPRRRWNRHLQRFEYLCLVAVSRMRDDPLEGDPALAKCLRLIGLESIDRRHLERTPRSYALALKRRWFPLT